MQMIGLRLLEVYLFTLKEKIFTPRSKLFLKEFTPFLERLRRPGKLTGSRKVVPLCRNGGKHGDVPMHLKLLNFLQGYR